MFNMEFKVTPVPEALKKYTPEGITALQFAGRVGKYLSSAYGDSGAHVVEGPGGGYLVESDGSFRVDMGDVPESGARRFMLDVIGKFHRVEEVTDEPATA